MNQHTPTWDHYRSFLAVLQEGSLSAAARRLGTTQPTVARHIDQLQLSLGRLQLFTRSPKGLSPTTAALRLAPYASTMAEAEQALIRTAHTDMQSMKGTVRISVSEVVGTEVLPEMIARFQMKQPDIRFEISLSNQLADLLQREADIAIRMSPPKQQALLIKHLGSIPLGLYADQSYLDQNGTPGSLSQIYQHRLIGFDRDTTSRNVLGKFGLSLEAEDFSYKTDSQSAQITALRAGCGIGICQVPLAARSPTLTRILKDVFEVPMGVWITTHEDLKSDPRIRAVMDHLSAEFKSYIGKC